MADPKHEHHEEARAGMIGNAVYRKHLDFRSNRYNQHRPMPQYAVLRRRFLWQLRNVVERHLSGTVVNQSAATVPCH